MRVIPGSGWSKTQGVGGPKAREWVVRPKPREWVVQHPGSGWSNTQGVGGPKAREWVVQNPGNGWSKPSLVYIILSIRSVQEL